MICRFPLIVFAKRLVLDTWQVSEYALDFEYTSVLNIPGFWMYQGCEYVSGFLYASS